MSKCKCSPLCMSMWRSALALQSNVPCPQLSSVGKRSTVTICNNTRQCRLATAPPSLRSLLLPQHTNRYVYRAPTNKAREGHIPAQLSYISRLTSRYTTKPGSGGCPIQQACCMTSNRHKYRAGSRQHHTHCEVPEASAVVTDMWWFRFDQAQHSASPVQPAPAAAVVSPRPDEVNNNCLVPSDSGGR